jgi:hypothetical protein
MSMKITAFKHNPQAQSSSCPVWNKLKNTVTKDIRFQHEQPFTNSYSTFNYCKMYQDGDYVEK